MATSFTIVPISPADIVFVYPRSMRVWDRIVRFINANGQRILAAVRKQRQIPPWARIRKYTHVMLGVGSGVVIHADGKKVSLEIISNALHQDTDEASFFKVYRRRDISHDLAEKIATAAIRYYNQKYSFFSFFISSPSEQNGRSIDKEDTTQFCSRLVAHAYRSAGAPLSSLPDNRVLPIDLYQICQSDEWIDISAEFTQEPVPAEVCELLRFHLPGHKEPLTLPEFQRDTEALIHKLAQFLIQFYNLKYKSARNILFAEVLLAKFCSLEFDIAKEIRIAPNQLDDNFATRVVRVLQQLEALLTMSLLPSIDVLIEESMVNKIGNQPDTSLFAGFPTPLAIREMQNSWETIRIYTYLLFAETGLFSILAHAAPHEELKVFRSVKREYVQKFLAAVHPIDNLSLYKDKENLFRWVDNETDRAMCQKIIGNIVAALEEIEND